MLRIAAAVVGIWFALGLAVALAVGRAGRRSGLESVIGAQPTVGVPAVTPRVDELAARRARRVSVGVRVAAAAAAVGVVGAVGALPSVASFGHRPASNVKAPIVVEEPSAEPAASAVERPAATVERFHRAERPVPPGLTRAADAPGQDPAGPGRSEDAPGQDPAGPGRSEDAPGQDPAGPGRSEVAPGRDSPAAVDARAGRQPDSGR